MNSVAIKPESEAAWKALRVFDITSTESSALFGLSPYSTEFQLWHQKRDKVEGDFEPNERMDWGTDLQDTIALSLARRYCVKVERIIDYKRIEDARMGASFDFKVFDHNVPPGQIGVADNSLVTMFQSHGPGLLEIKNVDGLVFKQTWPVTESGAIEAPPHIEIQLQHQMHVDDVEWGALGVLVGGNRGILLTRMRDREAGAAIEQRIRAFWQSIDDGKEPDPRYPADAGPIMRLFSKATSAKVFDGRGNPELDALIEEYKLAGDREKLAIEDKDVAKAKILRIIEDAERCYTDRYTINAAMVAGKDISYYREPYRGWRVTAKKT